jgi:hypothetical protein
MLPSGNMLLFRQFKRDQYDGTYVLTYPKVFLPLRQRKPHKTPFSRDFMNDIVHKITCTCETRTGTWGKMRYPTPSRVYANNNDQKKSKLTVKEKNGTNTCS